MKMPPAFRYRPFRLYWTGHLISIAGSQMQLWGVFWHLRTLTDRPAVISAVGLIRFLPILFLSLLAGVAADRMKRRRLALITQLLLALNALMLGFGTASGMMTIPLLFVMVALQSVVAAFDIPARQALIPSLIPREHLANAYSLNSIAAKVGGILGPALSGFVIAGTGISGVYWLNAGSYLAVVAALLAMGDIPQKREETPWIPGQALRDIRGGIRFILGSPIILSVMILDFFGSFFASAKTLLPFVARDILNTGPVGYGWLSASQSMGTVLVAFYISQKPHLRRQGLLICLSVILFGLATVLFGCSRLYWLTLLALFLVGIFDGLSSIIRNTTRQVLTPDSMRGRMISITQIFFKGGTQLGEVESGLAAQLLGVPMAIVSGGIGCVIAALAVIKAVPQAWKFTGQEKSAEE